MRSDNHYPMTPGQLLRYYKRKTISPEAAAKTADTKMRLTPPKEGDTVQAMAGTPPADDMDAGFYGALQMANRVVGDGFPLAVALRLFKAELARVVAPGKRGGL